MPDTALPDAIRKASRRLLPFLCILYLVNYLDRVNVSFAALTMNADLGLSPTAYGIGAGMFFVGYVLFEVPSNLLMTSVGARRWLGRIIISWGLVSTATCLIAGENGFYVLRFLLGAAEAGFFPGVIFFLVQWFPKPLRARMISLFMIGMPASSVIGAPVSSFILTTLEGVAGLTGWQWLFITEGVPTVLLGLACFVVLADRPAAAAWLEPRQRDALQGAMDAERRELEAVRAYSTFEALTNGRVMLLSLLFFMVATGMYGAVFWVPQIVKSFGVSNLAVGFITAIPFLLSVIAMVWWSRHADQHGEMIWHVAIPTVVSAIGFTMAGLWIGEPVIAMLGLSAGCVGMYSTAPVFWTLATSFLTGRAVAGAVALITSLGNLSGIAVPPLIGWSREATGGFSAAMVGLGVALLLAAVLTFVCGAVEPGRAKPREA